MATYSAVERRTFVLLAEKLKCSKCAYPLLCFGVDGVEIVIVGGGLNELAGKHWQVLVLESVHRGTLAKVHIVDLIEEKAVESQSTWLFHDRANGTHPHDGTCEREKQSQIKIKK